MGLTVFDAGPVLALLEREDSFHLKSAERYEELRYAGEVLLLPAPAFAEVMVKPWLSGPVAVEEVERGLQVLRFAIYPADTDVARAAARLRAQHGSRMRLPDALVVATALVRHADRVITTDGRWPVDVGVRVEVLQP
ncbi:MAG: type II toxin-antitoxin system VapC family toxin [Chloroflexota bacterium]